MSRENVELLRSGYRIYAEGDYDRLAAEVFHPDVEWSEPDAEGFPFAGTKRGFDAVVREIFQAVPQHFSAFEVRPDQFIDGGDTVVVLGAFRGTARDTGRSFEIPFVHVYDVRDGKVSRARNHTDTATFVRVLGRQLERA